MSSSGAPQDNDWDVAALLAEPTRRQVLEAVRAATSPVTRDAVAEAVGIDRRLAAFHLDRLADGGLLAVSFARPAGRAGGPGAGRTAKHYQPTNQPLQLSVPPRRYELVARILALAVGRSPRGGQAEALVVAREEGERVGRRHPPRGRRTRAAVTSSACGSTHRNSWPAAWKASPCWSDSSFWKM
jgi:predicted ArsR family transcriptional regulator